MMGLRILNGMGKRACAFAVAICCMVTLCAPTHAYAMVNLGAISLSMPGYAALTVGDAQNVNCIVSPMASSQIPNCSMDYCPSGCQATGVGGCTDASGQCTCNGGGYTTYYPTVNVYSDNPGVARATWSNGTLYVSAYSPGTATLTATASLRLFTPATSSMTVEVAAPASTDSGSASSGSSSTTGTAVTADGSSSNSVVAVSGTPDAASTVVATLVGDAAGVAVGDSATTGGQTLVASLADASVSAKDLIGKVAGTADQVMFWAGTDATTPDYIWYASGSKIAAAPAGEVDLTVKDITSSDKRIAGLAGDATYCAFDATSCSTLPGPMTLLWRTARVFPNDSYVTLYTYDAAAGKLVPAKKNLQVKEGYVSFDVSQGQVFVLSSDPDLDQVGAASTASYGTNGTDGTQGALADSAKSEMPVIPITVGVCVVAAIAAVATAASRKKKAAVNASMSNNVDNGIDLHEDKYITAKEEGHGMTSAQRYVQGEVPKTGGER